MIEFIKFSKSQNLWYVYRLKFNYFNYGYFHTYSDARRFYKGGFYSSGWIHKIHWRYYVGRQFKLKKYREIYWAHVGRKLKKALGWQPSVNWND